MSKATRLLLGSGGMSTEERRQKWRDIFHSFIQGIEHVLFVPYAGGNYDQYLERMRELNLAPGCELVGIHTFANARQAVLQAQAVFVGGGNSFRLLHQLYALDLLGPIRQRVQAGMPYIGVSAGTNMACPTMRTTNDMPIVEPPSLTALGLVPFQINPHYFSGAIHYESAQGLLKYGGETRDDRIREFHEMNHTPVVGLWEGTALRQEGKQLELLGIGGGCRVFRRGLAFEDRAVGSDLSDLLNV